MPAPLVVQAVNELQALVAELSTLDDPGDVVDIKTALKFAAISARASRATNEALAEYGQTV